MRILAVDLSSTQTGWAVGEHGSQIPQAIGTITPPSRTKTLGGRFCFTIESLLRVYKEHKCENIVCEMLNHFRGAGTVRALAGISGALIYAHRKANHKDVLFLRVSEARSVAGVDTSGKKKVLVKGKLKGEPDFLKKRALARCASLGIPAKNYDEGDAVIIFIGAGKLIRPLQIQGPLLDSEA